ncbi:radical SAM protein [Patescibacteria group bacterium]|nr:radical SAM protein [Patescibacteria group bacterium]MBU4309319.1 radical SAM protein [Patescibacteria group bacterium]MBU4577680.1 radical SAM protein [Patescibacteria group bacterium]
MRCKWCYGRTMNFSSREDMSLGTVIQAIKLFKELSLKNIILIGGEPTIHPQFLEIVGLIREAGMRPVLVTNAVRLADKQFLRAALTAGIDGITTSFKAGSGEQYRRLTGVDVFNDVMEAIANIEESGVSHKISVTVCGSMFNEFDELLGAVVKSGAKRLALDMERPVILNNEAQFSGSASPQEMADFFCKIYPKVDTCGMKTTVKITLPFCLFPPAFIDELANKKQLISGCQMFRGSGIILDTRGRLLPCNQFCDNPLGEMGGDFKTAEEFLLFRKKEDVRDFYAAVSSCPHEKCVNCSQWKFCGGGCRIHWLYREASELLGNNK